MNDPHTTRIRSDELDRPILDALAAMMDTAPAPANGPTDPTLLSFNEQPENQRRVLLGTAAAAVLLVGIGSLIVLQQQNDAGVSDSIPIAPEPAASVSTEPALTPAASSDPLANATGFFLPTYVPAGYQITNLAAQLVTPTSDSEFARWLRKSTNGDVTAEFSVSLLPNDLEAVVEIEPNATVRGLPAMIDESDDGIVVTWPEDDSTMSARGWNLTVDETLAAVEAMTIDATIPAAELPAGTLPDFERVELQPVALDDTVTTFLGLTRTDGLPGGFISVATSPNTNGETLETMQTQGGVGYELEVIGGIERLVKFQEPDSLGPLSFVEWIDGDSIVTIAGRAAPAEVVAVAEGYALTSREQFAAAGTSITNTGGALDVLDQASFDDDITVSVRSPSSGEASRGTVAICIDAPVQQCRFSLTGSYQNGLNAAFNINGDTVVIVWHDTAEADRLGEATLSANETPVDPVATSAAIGQQITTDAGRFTRINVPAGEQPPMLNYSTDDGQIGLSTSAPAPYDY